MVKFEQKFYFDAINYAASTYSKGKHYHISPNEFRLLIKLIHLAQANPVITYTNEILDDIAQIPANTIKDLIGGLKKSELIQVETKRNSDKGKFFAKRKILINWETIEKIYYEVPQPKWKNQSDESPMDEIPAVDQLTEITPQPEIEVKDEIPAVVVPTVDTPKVITPEPTPALTQPEPQEQTIIITPQQIKNETTMKLSEVEARAIINYLLEKFEDSLSIEEYSELVPLINDGKIKNNYEAELYCNRIVQQKKDNSSSEKNRLYQVLESKKIQIGEINYAILKEQIKNNTITKLAALLQEIKFRTIPGNLVQESIPAVPTPTQPEAKIEESTPTPVIQMEPVVEQIKNESPTILTVEAPVITMKSNQFPAPTPDVENEDEMTREKRLLSHLGVQRKEIGDDYYFRIAGNVYLKKYVNEAQVDWAIEDILANPPAKWGQVKSSKRKY